MKEKENKKEAQITEIKETAEETIQVETSPAPQEVSPSPAPPPEEVEKLLSKTLSDMTETELKMFLAYLQRKTSAIQKLRNILFAENLKNLNISGKFIIDFDTKSIEEYRPVSNTPQVQSQVQPIKTTAVEIVIKGKNYRFSTARSACEFLSSEFPELYLRLFPPYNVNHRRLLRQLKEELESKYEVKIILNF